MNEGHPDKLADQVSDAVLDACLKQDPYSKVACETATKDNMVMVFGEITTAATQRVLELARQAIPALADVAFPHVWTGLRPHTPDGMPIIDRLPAWDNAYLAAGHFTKGVLLAPVTGRLLAEWLVTGRPSAALEMFSLARFG